MLDLARCFDHVELTFDDGNISDFEIALPALQQRQLVATFFICSGRLHDPDYLDGQRVRELFANGMKIGSHGVAHKSWRGLDDSALDHELLSSRSVLENLVDSEVASAACPFGAYDRRVLKGLRRAKYHRIYTSDGGVSYVGHWLQARTTIGRHPDTAQLERFLRTGSGAFQQMLINTRKFIKRLR